MKTELFTLAEYVVTMEKKLVIVGTFEVVYGDIFPLPFKPFGVAAKFTADKREYGKTISLKLVVRKKAKVLLEIPLKIRFGGVVGSRRVIHNFAFMIGGLVFPTSGTYTFEMNRRGRVVCSTELYVEKIRHNNKLKQSK